MRSCNRFINNIYQSMNRSFYSSQRINTFDKNSTRPTGFRVLMKRRNNQLLDPLDQIKTQVVNQGHKSVQLESASSSQNLLKFNETLKNQSLGQNAKSIKEQQRSMMEKKMRSTSKSKASEGLNRRDKEESSISSILPELSMRLQKLIQKKLVKIKSFRSFKDASKEKDQIDIQIDKIIQVLNQIQTDDISELELNSEENLHIINEKILILEKIIAESSTESEMMKKYFHAKRFKKGINHKKLYQHQSLEGMRSSRYIPDHQTKKSIHFSTISKTSYQNPSKNDYAEKLKKKKHDVCKQPIPRSTYSRDYLVYGSLPSFSYKHEESKILEANSHYQNRSSYQTDFTYKQTNNVDFKQLDCFRDKFKNLKVSFNKQTKRDVVPIKKDYKGYLHPKDTPLPSSHYVKHLMSESRLNYDQKMGKKASIKHEALTKLKFNYKSKIQA